MKKWILGLVGVALLCALAVEQLVIAPKTVASVEELLDIFYQTRTSLPPIPSPVSYEEVASQLLEGRCDFIAHPYWAYTHSAGTYYLSDKSKLAEALVLPVRLVAYEDLSSGKVVLSASSLDSKEIQSLAVVDAPEFSAYEGTRSVESYLMKEMWPRRLVWSALLKSEDDAWADLLSSQELAAMAPAPMMMAMSASTSEPDNLFRIIQDGEDLSVNLPGGFVDAEIVLYSRTNLLAGSWVSVSTNVAVSNGVMSLGNADIPELIIESSISTNAISCPDHIIPDPSCTNCTVGVSTNVTFRSGGLIYYRATASSTNDTDGDGIPNLEEYDLGTDFDSADSDGDLMPDPYEFEKNFDPIFYADGGYDPDCDSLVNADEYLNGTDPYDSDSDDDGMLDGWEVSVGLNPLIANAAVDQDFDGLSNLEEYQLGFHPLNPDSDGDSVLDGNELSIAARDPNSSDATPPVITLTAPPQKIVIIP